MLCALAGEGTAVGSEWIERRNSFAVMEGSVHDRFTTSGIVFFNGLCEGFQGASTPYFAFEGGLYVLESRPLSSGGSTG